MIRSPLHSATGRVFVSLSFATALVFAGVEYQRGSATPERIQLEEVVSASHVWRGSSPDPSAQPDARVRRKGVASASPTASSWSFARSAHAFNGTGSFGLATMPNGGGGGRFFTGSPRDGFTCEVCHRPKEGHNRSLELRVKGLSEPIVPGKTYRLTIEWIRRGSDFSRIALNGEIVQGDGFAAGTVKADEETEKGYENLWIGGDEDKELLPKKRDTIFSLEAPVKDKTQNKRARLQWTAPKSAENNEIWVHIAAVGIGDDDEDGTPSTQNDIVSVYRKRFAFGRASTRQSSSHPSTSPPISSTAPPTKEQP